MPHEHRDTRTLDRRCFVKGSLIPATFPLAAALASPSTKGAEPSPGSVPAGPDIIDNTQAWAGSFEAVLHKQQGAINRRVSGDASNASIKRRITCKHLSGLGPT